MSAHVSLVSVIGTLTIVFSVLVKVIGIPAQIRRNFQRQSTDGVSLADQSIGFLAYFFWTVYGILRHDRVLIYGQILGVIATSFILYQFVHYRKKRNVPRRDEHTL
jgi:uncharacterized protein with PQ loop repeat